MLVDRGDRRRAGVALAAAVALSGLAHGAAIRADEPPASRQQPVVVDRVMVEARVLDSRGRPVRGLGARHFRLEVDGRPTAIESVRWVDHAPVPSRAPAPRAAHAAGAMPGRHLVLLFQKDLTSTRGIGLLRMQRHARDLVDGLGAGDRVAVASHDSRLRLWLDFTADRGAARHALERSVLFGRATAQPPGDAPSLRRHLEARAARDASSPEAALRVLADALEEIAGTRTLILFGWGMGELGPGGVRMTREYEAALAALSRVGVSVFTLDLTGADYHSLEAGLQQVARDTGGTYARTHLFPAAAMGRLEAALAGHYVIGFEPPPSPKGGEHRIRLRLVGARGSVLARTRYVDPE